ncbi:heavy metal translocating P-type ATPase [Neptunicella marina]|uniref:Cadmium-translocating P-type ATPase n=1 Tax=Neptunicella marina TaxID=2125989 RepID=A0A8J6M3F1_9ALTE|nr:heavy metal translocating P-type ATPase [Neptunicella marina]MBC3766942.1 cadmium-translocating P-type ATPase [Neptunicella marina]
MSDICYHCEQSHDEGMRYSAFILNEERSMCCPGCQSVARAIVDGGMQDYYRFRTEAALTAPEQLEDALSQLDIFDDSDFQQEFIHHSGNENQIQLTIEGISCAACGWLIERQLSRLNGVNKVGVNVAARRATINWQADQLKLSQLLATFEKIGYHAQPFQADQHEASYQKENKTYLKKLGLAGLMTMQIMMLALGLYFSLFGDIDPQIKSYFHAISMLLCIPVVLYAGSGFYKSAFNALRLGTVNMDVPISIAVWAAFIASSYATIVNRDQVYFESVSMFIFLLLISRYLEHRSRHKASLVSASIMKHMPSSATLLNEQGQFTTVLAKKLNNGDRILIKAGEMIPVDGVIIDGTTQIDESMLTGEFEPVTKTINDNVYGGSTNHQGVLTVVVTNTLNTSLINQIVMMQESALADKPQISQMADRLSRYFVSAVLVVAGLTYWYWQQYDAEHALFIAIAVLVATCPCALGLATPTALTSAMATLNRAGVLIKRADVLEKLNQIDTIAWDKTGTLTEGRFSIQAVYCFSPNYTENQVTKIAASLEQHSEHPIASAFESDEYFTVNQFKTLSGLGVSGMIDQQLYRLGSAAFCEINVPAKANKARVFLTCDNVLIAAFEIEDQLRVDAKTSINQLKPIESVLLSGDRQDHVSQIAKQLNIDSWIAECSPKQKLDTIKSQQQQGHHILMVGDGINDSPVMAVADVSVAVGSGTDLAKSSADVILLNTQLALLPYLIKIARLSKSKIRQNIAWALAYNLIVLPLAVCGLLTPWIAVIGMSASSLIVVGNSARLLKQHFGAA